MTSGRTALHCKVIWWSILINGYMTFLPNWHFPQWNSDKMSLGEVSYWDNVKWEKMYMGRNVERLMSLRRKLSQKCHMGRSLTIYMGFGRNVMLGKCHVENHGVENCLLGGNVLWPEWYVLALSERSLALVIFLWDRLNMSNTEDRTATKGSQEYILHNHIYIWNLF